MDFLEAESNIDIVKDNFEQAIENTTKKIMESLKECVKQANVSEYNIDLLILTGGTTEIPYIKRSILNMFPNAIISEDDKLSSVAQGLVYGKHNFS